MVKVSSKFAEFIFMVGRKIVYYSVSNRVKIIDYIGIGTFWLDIFFERLDIAFAEF